MNGAQQATIEELVSKALALLNGCNTIPLATENFLYEANAISRARNLLDKAERILNAKTTHEDSPPAIHGADQNSQRS